MLNISVIPPLPLFHADEDDLETHKRHPDEEYGMDEDDEDFGEGPSTRYIATPGQFITTQKDVVQGHGTYRLGENLMAHNAGAIVRTNKLIRVDPVRQRYDAQQGDLVVGRITEVGQERWKVDINSRFDASLLLSAVNLPGGVQRRKVESDALNMRSFLSEGDLLVAEVQKAENQQSSLHTRSLKFGKPKNGRLVHIPPSLIRRLKSHFLNLPPPCGPHGVDVVLGLNGYVWVSLGVGEEKKEGAEGFDGEGVYSDQNDEISPESRTAITLISNLILLFAHYFIPLTDTLLIAAYKWATTYDSGDRLGALEPGGGQVRKGLEDEMVGSLVGESVDIL